MSGYSTPGSQSESIGSYDQDFQWVDNLSIVRGNHNLKIGGDLLRERFWEITDFSGVPSFTFTGQFSGSTMADMLLGIPDTAVVAYGNSLQDLRSTYYSMYIQDDWRFRPNLTLNLGFRYEYTQPPWDIHNRTVWFNPQVGNLQYSDLNQVQQRHRDARPPQFQPAGGICVFTRVPARHGSARRLRHFLRDRKLEHHAVHGECAAVLRRGNPDLQFDRAHAFPGKSCSRPSPRPAPPPSRSAVTTALEPPTWRSGTSASSTRSGKNWLADVAYVGNRGNHTVMRRNLDAASFDPYDTAPVLSTREPWPQFAGILLEDDGGFASYNALSAKLERRISGGLYVMGSYTWSHCMDLTSAEGDQSFAGQNFDVYNHGQCTYNVPQRFVANYVYELPFGPGKQYLGSTTGVAGKLIGGWQVTGITTFAMGQFVSVSLPGNWMNVGPFTTAVPNKVGPTNNPSRTLLNWWNVNSFEYPGCAPGLVPTTPSATVTLAQTNCPTQIHVEGNAGRDQIEVPGLNDWDMGLMKQTQISERVSMQFRAEFFNAWNHAQFSTPSTSYVPTTFGRITSLLITPRQVQLGLKLNF